MQVIRRHYQLVMFSLAVTSPLAVTTVLVPFRATFTNAAAALILVAIIAAVSVGGNRFTGFVASVFSALWFDFFLTRPYDRLTISHRPDIEITVCLLAVGLMVSELAARSRHFSRISDDESHCAAMVRELTQLAQLSDIRLIERAESMMIELLDLRDCGFAPQPSDPPMAHILPSGEVVHVGMRWPVAEMGIPGPEAEIVTQWRRQFLGRFVLIPTPGKPVSRGRRSVAALLASVVAAGLANDKSSF